MLHLVGNTNIQKDNTTKLMQQIILVATWTYALKLIHLNKS